MNPKKDESEKTGETRDESNEILNNENNSYNKEKNNGVNPMLSKKSKRKILIIILFLIIPVIIIFNAIFEQGIFEDDVFHYSGEFGKKGTPFSREIFFKTNEPNDYNMIVEYKSKGAFMAGRKIDVKIYFKTPNTNKINSSNRLFVVFPGAINYPIPDDPIEKLADKYIELKFIDESVASGNGSIIYYMPEYYKESTIIFGHKNFQIENALSNDTRFTYELLIDGNMQLPEYTMRKNRFLSIAPLETYLQLKTNNMIIFLTIVAIILGIFQIIMKED